MASGILRFSVVAAFIILVHACTNKEIVSPAFTDADLFAEITASGYTYYQGGNILVTSPPGPHGAFVLRFNAIAAGALDSSGELPVGATFPTGSVLVKEVHASGMLTLYAVMKKDPSSSNAGGGWLWAEITPSGSVIASITTKGSACVSCHSETPNRDLSRAFDFH